MRLVIVVDKPVEVTDRSFETAAWWVKLTLQPGEYEMRAPEPRGPDIWWGHIPGVVVEDYFASLWGGMPISKYDTHKNAGQVRTYGTMVRTYEMADVQSLDRCEWHYNPETKAMEGTPLYRIEKRD